MATATAAVTSKTEEAGRLRAAIQTTSEELRQLRQTLAVASGALATLQEKRRQFADAAADGKPQPSAKVAALHSEIDEAELPVGTLQNRVTQKEGELEGLRGTLETLNREIAIEAQQAARRARFDQLKHQSSAAAARIAETLRSLVEEQLPNFCQLRDELGREFVAVAQPDALTAEGRELLAGFTNLFFDGPFLRTERKLLRADWIARGDLAFTVPALRPPKR